MPLISIEELSELECMYHESLGGTGGGSGLDALDAGSVNGFEVSGFIVCLGALQFTPDISCCVRPLGCVSAEGTFVDALLQLKADMTPRRTGFCAFSLDDPFSVRPVDVRSQNILSCG